MNSIKAFLKAKGLYLVCLALVFAATITGIAAIRSVVRGVCIVILAAGGWAVWQRLRRDWQLCCFVRAAGNLAACWLER